MMALGMMVYHNTERLPYYFTDFTVVVQIKIPLKGVFSVKRLSLIFTFSISSSSDMRLSVWETS